MPELLTKYCPEPSCSTLWHNVLHNERYCKNCGCRIMRIDAKTAQRIVNKDWLYAMNQYDYTSKEFDRKYKQSGQLKLDV